MERERGKGMCSTGGAPKNCTGILDISTVYPSGKRQLHENTTGQKVVLVVLAELKTD